MLAILLQNPHLDNRNKLLPKIIIYTQKANIDKIRHNKKPIFVENVGFISQSPAKSQQPG